VEMVINEWVIDPPAPITSVYGEGALLGVGLWSVETAVRAVHRRVRLRAMGRALCGVLTGCALGAFGGSLFFSHALSGATFLNAYIKQFHIMVPASLDPAGFGLFAGAIAGVAIGLTDAAAIRMGLLAKEG
jgi:hypothetical protein